MLKNNILGAEKKLKGESIMAKITITKGNEFMIAVRDEITKDDLFIEQYERAANILDRIVGASI